MGVVQSCARAVMVPHTEGLLVSVTVLKGGTLTSSAGIVCRCEYGPSGCGKQWWVRVWFVGTLLGPEGTGRPVGVGVFFAGSSCPHTAVSPVGAHGWWGRVGGFWLYVENCTVDASIF